MILDFSLLFPYAMCLMLSPMGAKYVLIELHDGIKSRALEGANGVETSRSKFDF